MVRVSAALPPHAVQERSYGPQPKSERTVRMVREESAAGKFCRLSRLYARGGCNRLQRRNTPQAATVKKVGFPARCYSRDRMVAAVDAARRRALQCVGASRLKQGACRAGLP